ncbi:MAG: hypothetical protein QOD66_4132 [Solirubrobacteraceae bacterium]|jgi:hypothetical protein|nr:hypothetical protein [Solirubrobacteraceae bacterium]
MASRLTTDRRQRSVRILAAAMLLALLLIPLTSGVARADGDPASDVLLGENVFYPYSPPVTTAIQKTLDAEAAAAAKDRYALKVALIGSPVDLGVIPDLFGKPQKYADFLDQEISFQGKQRLLVVMSTGYGVQGLGPAAQKAVASLPKPAGAQPNDLARAAISAVAVLAKADGHPLKGVAGAPAGGGSGGGSSSTVLVVILGLGAAAIAAALVAVTVRRRRAEAGA